MRISLRPSPSLLLSVTWILFGSLSAWSQLTVYEGFDYPVESFVAGQSGGLGLAGAWVEHGVVTTAEIVQGLSFSGLQASGGALRLSHDNRDGTVSSWGNRAAVSRNFAIEVEPGTTLWQSFLFRPDFANADANVHVAASVGPDNAEGSNALGIAALRWGARDSGQQTPLPQIGFGDPGSINFSQPMAYGSTYLFIARFEGVGTLSQNADGWILTESAYNQVLTQGLSEASLDANAFSTASASSQTLGLLPGLSEDRFLTIGGPTSTQAADYRVVIDEVRFGETLASVTPEGGLIVEDTQAPVLELAGAKVVIPVGGAFEDPGATATDNVDGDLTTAIVTSWVGPVLDVDSVGRYLLQYSVSDTAGNTASVTREIAVVEENLPSTIPDAERLEFLRSATFPIFSHIDFINDNHLLAAQSMYAFAHATFLDETRSLEDGTPAAALVLSHIRRLFISEPSVRGGIYGWVDGRIALSLLLARNTPAVWSQLSDDEVEKVDWLMRAFAVAGHFQMDDGNNFHQMLDGDGNFNKNWNPNHQEGYVAAVIAAALYFGPDNLNEFFLSFDYNSTLAKFNELGFSNIVNAWNRTPATRNLMMNGGQSISDPDVNPATGGQTGEGLGVRNEFTYKGEPLDNAFGIFRHLALRLYHHEVVSTIPNPGGGEIKILGESTGATVSPFEGQTGMLLEFRSSDANGIRSSARYTFDSLINSIPTRATLQLLGQWPDNPAADEIINRMNVGIGDWLFKVREGYQGWQKGTAQIVRAQNLERLGYLSLIQIFESLDTEFFGYPLISVPEAPANLRAAPQSANAVLLSWSDQALNEDAFEVYRATDNASWENLATLPADSLSFLDEEPVAGKINQYLVRALNSEGPSLVSTVASVRIQSQAGSLLLDPVADAYVNSGNNAGSNYGSSTDLVVKDGAGDGFDRKAYLQFDLRDVTSTILQAELEIYSQAYGAAPHRVHEVADDSWQESTITWNNAPAEGDIIAEYTMLEGLNIMDVTDFVIQEHAGDGIVTLALTELPNSNIYAGYFSRESAFPPVLRLNAGDLFEGFPSEIDSNWSKSPWFGWYYTKESPWIWKPDLGWTYALRFPSSRALLLWIHDEASWFYTIADYYPVAYSYNDSDWINLSDNN